MLRLIALTAGFAAVATATRPTTRIEMAAQSEKLAKYEAAFAQCIDGWRNAVVPTEDSECWKTSKGFADKCTDRQCGDMEDAPDSVNMDSWSDEEKTEYLCCRENWDDGADGAYGAVSCEEARDDFKEKFFGSDECCDVCALATDTATAQYKATCTAEFLQGASVCGVVEEEDPLPNSEVYFRDTRCSTGPDHSFYGAEEECEWVEIESDPGNGEEVCKLGECASPWNQTAFDEYMFAIADGTVTDDATFKALSEAAQTIPDALFGIGTRAYVMNDPESMKHANFTKASITVDMVTADKNDDQCWVGMMENHNEGDIIFTAGIGFMYNPTSTAAATIQMTGDTHVTVIAGNSASEINISSTGQVQVYNVVNSGDILINDSPDIFVSGVTNRVGGNIEVSNSKASIFNTSNSAVIHAKNGGKFHAFMVTNEATGVITIGSGVKVDAEFCKNDGKIVFEEGASGTISAPAGSDVTVVAGVTLSDYVKKCTDDTTWKKKGRTCAWVLINPEKRCKKKVDGVKASIACPIACSSTQCGMSECVNKSEWRVKLPNGKSKNCNYLKKKSKKRCALVGTDNTFGYEACCGICKIDSDKRA